MIGLILSQLTLAAVNRQQGFTNAEIQPAERFVRRVYRLFIGFTSLYFYLSIPVLVLVVILAIGAIFYGFLYVGQVPVRLAIFILVAGGYTLYAIARSLFMRRKQTDPGKELKRADAFYLWQILESTARQLNTRPVDRVFITAGTQIAVYERGGWRSRLNGKSERCLILGLGALPGMNQGQFQAILAHEYGHFNHADTAGGDLAASVGFQIYNLANGLVRVGTATWFNPVWLFIKGYYRIFLRVTQGASRLQEILADRYAAINFGVENLKTGLEHVIHQDLLFSRQVENEIQVARTESRPLNNLYALPLLENNPDLEAAFQKAMNTPTSAYDSHPAPCERLAYIERIRNNGYDHRDTRPAWDLLSSSATLQEEMTEEVVSNLRAKGAYWTVTGQAEEAT